MTPAAIAIGHGVTIRFTGIYGQPADVKGGIIVAHRHPDGTICEGLVNFDVPANADLANRPKWTVESWDPLTISPSVHNTGCGLHGFIRDGKWIPA